MLSDIEIVRLYIGDTSNSALYPKISDEEIEYFIQLTCGNLQRASRHAASAVLAYLASIPIRERTGQIEVWSNVFSNYLAMFNRLITTPVDLILAGFRPWSSNPSNPLACVFDPCEDDCQIKRCGCES